MGHEYLEGMRYFWSMQGVWYPGPLVNSGYEVWAMSLGRVCGILGHGSLQDVRYSAHGSMLGVMNIWAMDMWS